MRTVRVQAAGDAKGFDVPEIGFPSYLGSLYVMDRGATEYMSFTKCQGDKTNAVVPPASPE